MMQATDAATQIDGFSTYDRASWQQLRQHIPMRMEPAELEKLQGVKDPISKAEVEEIYLPLAELLHLHCAAANRRHSSIKRFLKTPTRVPFVIGVTGSVAVGKSTTAKILSALLQSWPYKRNVARISADCFLYSKQTLEAQDLMSRKGFPESYDMAAILGFLKAVKRGEPSIHIPRYSHRYYDILPDEQVHIQQPDILIIDGLMLLQNTPASADQQLLSDFLDIGIYVDAPTEAVGQWYLQRFLAYRQQAADNPDAYFYQYAQMSDQDAEQAGQKFWQNINLPNLQQHILPSKHRADVILEKQADHEVGAVLVRYGC